MRMFSPTRSGLVPALVAIAVLAPDWASAATDRVGIGGVDLVRIWASGTPPETGKRDLFVADKVFRNEVVETVRDGALHLRFIDDTEFKLGSDSRATLDSFIYDPASNAGELTLSLKEGLFRLKTGRIKKEGILLITPVALIEVRGSDVTIEVLKDGTTRVSVSLGEARMRSQVDGSRLVLTPDGDGGQVAPDGSVAVYAGEVGAGDSGILAGAAFETDPTFQIANSGSNEDLTEVTYQSASAGQTLSALSPLAVFDATIQTALNNMVTGVGFLPAAEGEKQVAALDPTVMTDGTTVSSVVGAVTDTVISIVASMVTETQVAVGIFGTGSFPNGNGGFETGDFTGFVPIGGFAIITSLGPLTPTEGQFMAFLTTGLNAFTGLNAELNNVGGSFSTLTTEPFLLAAGVDTISFDFNFLSDEFPIFVGSVFNDNLEVTISDTQGNELVFQELASVNSSTFIDITGTGTGFNGMTGFETTELDVSQFVGTGELTLDFQISNVTDTANDSGLLLDNLILE